MSAWYKLARGGPPRGLFRPASHVLAARQGAAIAILDLDHGAVYATTPFGAESWESLVGDTLPSRRAVSEAGGDPGGEEGPESWAGVAGYLLDRKLIEPVPFTSAPLRSDRRSPSSHGVPARAPSSRPGDRGEPA